MIEIVLEERYPKTLKMKDGRPIVVRPVEKKDEDELNTFFNEFPQEDLAYLRDNVRNPKIIHQWLENLNFEHILPLLAFHEGKIVGDATLHQDERGWQTHVGHVRVVTHPKFRGQRIASQLVGEIIEIAEHSGLVKLDAEFMAEQGKPISAFHEMGFIPTATLPGHVQDLKGNFHDLVIMVYGLREEERFAAD